MSIPGRLPHCGFSHRFKLNTDLPSMPDKDKWLLYNLTKRLVFIRESTAPDVHACVSYIITRIESPTLCHEIGHLQVDVLLVKKIRLFVLSSTEDQCAHLELLFSKHTKYLLKITQQIIQSQRFKKISITLKRALKKVTEWFNSDPHIILTKCTTDYQEHTNNDTNKDKYELVNQGVKTTNDRYYNTHQKYILLNTVTESDI